MSLTAARLLLPARVNAGHELARRQNAQKCVPWNIPKVSKCRMLGPLNSNACRTFGMLLKHGVPQKPHSVPHNQRRETTNVSMSAGFQFLTTTVKNSKELMCNRAGLQENAWLSVQCWKAFMIFHDLSGKCRASKRVKCPQGLYTTPERLEVRPSRKH